jgi:hypothetical protein
MSKNNNSSQLKGINNRIFLIDLVLFQKPIVPFAHFVTKMSRKTALI